MSCGATTEWEHGCANCGQVYGDTPPSVDEGCPNCGSWDRVQRPTPAAQDRERELLALLEEARQSLIDHARQLPLSKREHGPVLVKIDAATGRNRRAES